MGVRKNPADITTPQINSVSLNFTFKTDRGSAMPKTRSNSSARTKGKRRIVVGGMNWNAAMKIPSTANSQTSIIADVIPALKPGIDLGK